MGLSDPVSRPQTSRLYNIHPCENLKSHYEPAYCTAHISMNKTVTEATTQTWQRHSFPSSTVWPTVSTPASLAGTLWLCAANVNRKCPVMTNLVKACTERSVAGWIKVEIFITTEFKQKHWFHNLNLLTSMRAGNWDFLCVLKAENISRLLSHASLFCNDVCIRTCQHAKLKLYIWFL
jgi:hypothetical protein